MTIATGQSECQACDPDSEASDFRDECLCNVGFYARDSDDPTDLCEECDVGHFCESPGITYQTLAAREGFWFPNSSKAIVYRCLYEKNCGGGPNAECLGHHTGILCAACEDGYFATARGNCNECPSERKSWAYFVMVLIVVIILLWLQFFVVLRAGSGHMKHVKVKDAQEKDEQYWSEVVGVGLAYKDDVRHTTDAMRVRAARAAEASLHGTPSPKPNFTYKMKIVLGFLQIVTAMVVIIESPLPTGFKEFMSWFNLVNFDFFQASGTECVIPSNYYTKYLVIALTPIVIFVLVSILYLLPKYLGKAFQVRAMFLRIVNSAWF